MRQARSSDASSKHGRGTPGRHVPEAGRGGLFVSIMKHLTYREGWSGKWTKSSPSEPRLFVCRSRMLRQAREDVPHFCPAWRQTLLSTINLSVSVTRYCVDRNAFQYTFGNSSGTDVRSAFASSRSSVSQTHLTCPSIRAMTPRLMSHPWSWHTLASLLCDHPS